jgi:hypothetical protein
MASIRRHARSPYWYLRKREPDGGKWTEQTTGLRADDPADTRKAQRLADAASIKEKATRGTDNPAFVVWVPAFIAAHGARKAAGTARRMVIVWQALRQFLASEGIIYPRQIRYAHGEKYIVWRKKTPLHGRAVGHNTALLEIKFLSQLLNEAVRREYVETNQLVHLGIARAPQKIKPELTDDQIRTLLERSRSEPKWLERCIWIATYTGCRFSECAIESSHVDIIHGTITLTDAKRQQTDPRKLFTVPLPIELLHIFAEMHRNVETVTCRLSQDKNGRINYFFRQCGVPASFHSLRVTFITRCHRGGLTESQAMALVNHSSSLVHRLYSRLGVEDKRAARSRVTLPSLIGQYSPDLMRETID